MRNLLVVVLVGLVVYTVIDVVRSEPAERHGVARPLWIALILLLPVFGSVIWLVARHVARSGGAGGGRSPGAGGSRPGPVPGAGPRRPTRPLAPDDDPEFLWRLEQQQRRQRHEGGGPDGTGGTPPATPRDADDEAPGPTRP